MSCGGGESMGEGGGSGGGFQEESGGGGGGGGGTGVYRVALEEGVVVVQRLERVSGHERECILEREFFRGEE